MSIRIFQEKVDTGDVLGVVLSLGSITDLNEEYLELANRTPLMYAACYGSVVVLEAMVSASVNIDIDTPNQLGRWTALHFASDAGRLDNVKVLLEHGASVDRPSGSDRTALHIACVKGNLDIVSTLIDHGADLGCKDLDGWLALHFASYNKHIEIVKLLLDAGADKTIRTEDGDTALDLANWKNYHDVIKMLSAP